MNSGRLIGVFELHKRHSQPVRSWILNAGTYERACVIFPKIKHLDHHLVVDCN